MPRTHQGLAQENGLRDARRENRIWTGTSLITKAKPKIHRHACSKGTHNTFYLRQWGPPQQPSSAVSDHIVNRLSHVLDILGGDTSHADTAILQHVHVVLVNHGC